METAISEVHRLLSTGGVPNSLPSVVVLAVADGLFGLCGSERADELFMSSPLPPLSPSLISLIVYVDVKRHVYLLTYPNSHIKRIKPKSATKSEFYHICVFQFAYEPLMFDLDLVSE